MAAQQRPPTVAKDEANSYSWAWIFGFIVTANLALFGWRFVATTDAAVAIGRLSLKTGDSGTNIKNTASCPQIDCGKAAAPGWQPPPASLPLQDFKSLWGDWSKIDGTFQLERFWDMADVKNALISTHTAQMQPVIKKLYEGQPLTVVGIGSSIVQDMGGCYQPSLERIYELVPIPQPVLYGEPPGRRGQGHGWLELFMRYVNNNWPHPDHILINAGRSASGLGTFATGSCLEISLPPTADIIILETMGISDPIHTEKLVWRLYRHFLGTSPTNTDKTPPAIIVYSSIEIAERPPPGAETWGLFCGIQTNGNYSKCCSHAEFRNAIQQQAWDPEKRGQAMQLELARYYGFGAISHRDFLWPYVKQRLWEKMNLPWGECQFMTMVNGDMIHPNRLGQILIADYLWAYLSLSHEEYARQEQYARDVQQGDETALRRLFQGNTPLLPLYPFKPQGRDIYSMRCYGFLGAEGNILTWEHPQEGATGAVSELPIVGGNGGFEFMLNQVHGNETKRKPGWVSQNIGAFIDIKVDTVFQRDKNPPSNNAVVRQQQEQQQPPSPEIAIVYLKSYEHMGQAEVSCISGCECTPVTLDGHHEDRTSISVTHVLTVTEHKECVFRVKVLEGTKSGEHKFKIVQVVSRGKVN